jgi:hypothetical protein
MKRTNRISKLISGFAKPDGNTQLPTLLAEILSLNLHKKYSIFIEILYVWYRSVHVCFSGKRNVICKLIIV